MKTTNVNATDRKLAYASPYDVEPAHEVHNPVVMAALSIGMIVLLWSVSR